LRPIPAAAGLVLAAVTLISCGASSVPGVASLGSVASGRPASSARLTPEQARLAWASCMRQHGVSVADPGQQGAGPQPVANKVQYLAAQQACGHFLRDAGLDTHKTPTAEQIDQLVQYARCMRDHGIQVSDPRLENGGVSMDLPKGSMNTPQYRQADQACRHLLGSKGGDGSGGPKG
jgi:hypothetical protein